MKVLALYPAFDVRMNEMAMAWQAATQDGGIECYVACSSEDRLKAQVAEVNMEDRAGLTIRRFPGSLSTDENAREIVAWASAICPDIIFCAVHFNLPLALKVRKAVGAPIVLHTEYFLDNRMLLRRRWHLGIPWLRALVCSVFREWVRVNTAVVVCSNPREFTGSGIERKVGFSYLPWPHPLQGEQQPSAPEGHTHAVYLGSLSRGKGAETLSRYFGRLLRNDPTSTATIIGPPVDEAGKKALELLQAAGGGRVEFIRSCDRQQALRHIGRATFVFSPADRLGWGLIGDAWSVGTPILAVAEHYDLSHGRNCWVVADEQEFIQAVHMLREDPNKSSALVAGGRRTVVENHGIRPVVHALKATLQNLSAR